MGNPRSFQNPHRKKSERRVRLSPSSPTEREDLASPSRRGLYFESDSPQQEIYTTQQVQHSSGKARPDIGSLARQGRESELELVQSFPVLLQGLDEQHHNGAYLPCDSAEQGKSRDELEELQLEENSWQGDDYSDATDLINLSDEVIETSDTDEALSRHGEATSWVFDNTLGSLLFQILETSGEEIAFTYCQ